MAADKSKEDIGEMPCPNDDCESHDVGRNVIVFRNGNGTLSYTCDKCRARQYAAVGEPVHGHWLSRIEKTAGRAAPHAPVVAAPAAPAAKVAQAKPQAPAAKPEEKPLLF